VAELAEDMASTGWDGPPISVVDIDSNLYIVDGHHRFRAAMRAQVDVPYAVVDPSEVIGPRQWSSVADIHSDWLAVGSDRIR